jgi:hypothetical protein
MQDQRVAEEIDNQNVKKIKQKLDELNKKK